MKLVLLLLVICNITPIYGFLPAFNKIKQTALQQKMAGNSGNESPFEALGGSFTKGKA